MGLPWVYSVPTGRLSHETPMDLPRVSRGNPMSLPWFDIAIARVSHGSPLGPPWDFHGW